MVAIRPNNKLEALSFPKQKIQMLQIFNIVHVIKNVSTSYEK
jgi:hypothetical protein